MAIRPILVLPDPILRKVSTPVASITKDIRTLADDMLETMYDAPGVGLAAIQIGVAQRIVVIDTARKDEEKKPEVYINPVITARSHELADYEEGCLSIPEYYEHVTRPARVTVKYMGIDGKDKTVEADGLLATCLQHEIDHLDGKLFIDYLSKLKRDRVQKKFIKLAKERARDADEE
ncbi:MAG: peptide deformylase [Beijerinckiaceae bacterium]